MKEYLSQKYRNMRRDSEPTEKKTKDQKKKLITVAHVNPVAAANSPQSVEKCDTVAYERNVEFLQQELKQSQPRNDAIKSLLRLMFEQRREKISSSTACTTELLEDYPFFKIKKWVCVAMYACQVRCQNQEILYIYWE